MANIKFEDIQEDVAAYLKLKGIKETDLYNHSSDLYVGCPDYVTAMHIMRGGIWKAMSSIFVPQKGSDMDKYPYAVDIPFAYLKAFVDDMTRKKDAY